MDGVVVRGKQHPHVLQVSGEAIREKELTAVAIYPTILLYDLMIRSCLSILSLILSYIGLIREGVDAAADLRVLEQLPQDVLTRTLRPDVKRREGSAARTPCPPPDPFVLLAPVSEALPHTPQVLRP